MAKEIHYQSLGELIESFSVCQTDIINEIEKQCKEKSLGMQSKLQRNRLVYTFSNGSWVYFTKDYEGFVLGFGRGVRLIKKYPILSGAFSEVKKVVAKIVVRTMEDVGQKGCIDLLQLHAEL